jgi:hypothetical protein
MVFKAAGAGIRGVKGTYQFGKRMHKEVGRAHRTGGRASAAYKAAGMLASGPGKLVAESAKDVLKPSGKFWSILSKNKTILGINVGVGAFLKQSQVFTGAISSILQIVGAMVDVLIAPWLIPLIIPLAKKMASAIPKIQEWSQALADKYVPIIKDKLSAIWNGEGSFMGKIWDSIKSMVNIVWTESGLQKWWQDAEGKLGYFRDSMQLLVDVISVFDSKKGIGGISTNAASVSTKEDFHSKYLGAAYERSYDEGVAFGERLKGYGKLSGDVTMNPYGAGGLGPGFTNQIRSPGGVGNMPSPNNLTQGIQKSWLKNTLDALENVMDYVTDEAGIFSNFKK